MNRIHGAKGNVTFIPAGLRGAGVTDDMTLNWDFDNRLSSADIGSDGSIDRQFRYDALGRRVAIHDGTEWHHLVVAGQQLLMVYKTDGTALRRFVYASYIDEPIVLETLGAQPAVYYYHRNQQYSITALTDTAGAVVERYAYDPHGALTNLDASGVVRATSALSNPFQYTGRYADSTLNLHYFRARYYSPTLGRFLSRDPLGYVDGMSLYRAYFVPEAVDPEGLAVFGLIDGEHGPDLIQEEPIWGGLSKVHWAGPEEPGENCPCRLVGLYQIASTYQYHRWLGFGRDGFFTDANSERTTEMWHDDTEKAISKGVITSDAMLVPNSNDGVLHHRATIPFSGRHAYLKDYPGIDKPARTLIYLRQQFETCAVCVDSKSPKLFEVFWCVKFGSVVGWATYDPMTGIVNENVKELQKTMYIETNAGDRVTKTIKPKAFYGINDYVKIGPKDGGPPTGNFLTIMNNKYGNAKTKFRW